jgi:hypothetical protein
VNIPQLSAIFGTQVFYYLWLGLGVVGFLLWCFVAYRFARFCLGHKRVRGVWFKPNEFDELLDRLQIKAKDGVSLTAEDWNMLDKFRPGWRIGSQKMGAQEFVGWGD